MAPLERILENLARAQEGFLCAAGAVPSEEWKTPPREGAWSAAELVAHLIMVERTIVSGAGQLVRKPAERMPFYKRLHFPMALVESRWIRRKTPIPLDPQLVREKEEMLAELRGVREKTLAFMRETKDRDLRKYRKSHAFLGSLNAYEWFQMIASHEVRHTKQMREIAAALPKVVANLQK